MSNPKRRGHLVKRLVILVLVLLVAGALAMGALHIRKKRLDGLDSEPSPVLEPWALELVAVRRGQLARSFPALATIKSKAEIIVYGQLGGTILKMGPREGVAVEKGQMLAQIDARELKETIAATEARLGAAKALAANRKIELDRERKLLSTGGTTRSRADALEAAHLEARDSVRALERQIKGLRVRLGYATVVAESKGVVAARLVEPGQVCLPQHALYRIAVSGGARVSLRLPQEILGTLSPGSTFELHQGAESLKVRIDRIHPSLDAHALGVVEADLESRPFGAPDGARVAARVMLAHRDDALIVPLRSFLSRGSSNQGVVFRVRGSGADARLEAVQVVRDLVSARSMSVTSDLAEGDRVVEAHRSVLLRLRDGDAVIDGEASR